uniref:S-adenosylmethionine-dependent methyltransferase At5g38100 n=1 Tax=Bixa orellana TaxID=66672 RepID=A0A9Y0ZFQ6_BIXOR|nr:putative S-adenosylmethionine-dependent methyltransferase At5g38100 [Bixa orellana]
MAVNVVKENIDDAIMMKLDLKKLSSGSSKTFCIADLGCAAGPNAILNMQDIMDTIKQKHQLQCGPDSKMLHFQVFFNDKLSNDFNTLFSYLPLERQYFAAAVPGSFHTQLFPESSVHFMYCSYALHWLSTIPEELLDKNSPAWNKGRIHYSYAADEVINTYASGFAKDVENFLDARAKELVVGGMMVIIMPGIPDGMPYSQLTVAVMYDFMASIFMDMANEGLMSEEQVDSFNLPIYAASPSEMSALLEKNGQFSIERMELTNPATWLDGPVDIPVWVMHVRAAMEGMFAKHFGSQIVDEMFSRLSKKLLEHSDQVQSGYWERTQLFLILTRK